MLVVIPVLTLVVDQFHISPFVQPHPPLPGPHPCSRDDCVQLWRRTFTDCNTLPTSPYRYLRSCALLSHLPAVSKGGLGPSRPLRPFQEVHEAKIIFIIVLKLFHLCLSLVLSGGSWKLCSV